MIISWMELKSYSLIQLIYRNSMSSDGIIIFLPTSSKKQTCISSHCTSVHVKRDPLHKGKSSWGMLKKMLAFKNGLTTVSGCEIGVLRPFWTKLILSQQHVAMHLHNETIWQTNMTPGSRWRNHHIKVGHKRPSSSGNKDTVIPECTPINGRYNQISWCPVLYCETSTDKASL